MTNENEESKNEWTEQQVERLIYFIKQRFTSGQIAQRLSITRNAVLGKVNRMGLKLENDNMYNRYHSAGKVTHVEKDDNESGYIRRDLRPTLPEVRCLKNQTFSTFKMIPFKG